LAERFPHQADRGELQRELEREAESLNGGGGEVTVEPPRAGRGAREGGTGSNSPLPGYSSVPFCWCAVDGWLDRMALSVSE